MLKTGAQPPAKLTTSRTVAGAMNYTVANALAACEPQALDGGAVFFGGTMKCTVVKRRRQRSGQITHGVEASGGFLPLALCQIATALARRGACVFGLLQAA